MSTFPKVYLAGPGVFRPNAPQIGEQLKAVCTDNGLEGLWPLDGEISNPRDTTPMQPFGRASEIFRANVAMIKRSVAVIADISPFRGPHMDCGTAWEIGTAFAFGKSVYAYTAAPGLASRIWSEKTPTGWRDQAGNLVEDFALVENLMIACSVVTVQLSAETAIQQCAYDLRKSLAEKSA